jgi:hypothetical protein
VHRPKNLRTVGIIGVVDAAPAQAAGRTFAGDVRRRDQAAEVPLVAAVVDEREIAAPPGQGNFSLDELFFRKGGVK